LLGLSRECDRSIPGRKEDFKTLEDLKTVPCLDPAKIDARKDRLEFQ
jgi:hypothetical protein